MADDDMTDVDKVPSPNTQDKAPDLFGWILIITFIVLIPYVLIRIFGENQIVNASEALTSFVAILSFFSSVFYIPVIIFAIRKNKNYMVALGPLKLYLAVGPVFMLWVTGPIAVSIFKLLAKYISYIPNIFQ